MQVQIKTGPELDSLLADAAFSDSWQSTFDGCPWATVFQDPAFVRIWFDRYRTEFKDDVAKTKKILEDLCGTEVRGFRAASFSIGEDNLWALGALDEVGYRYSSSIYPVRHDLYGMPTAPRFPFKHLERPPTVIRSNRDQFAVIADPKS